jgi:hypothetical protein
MIKYEPPLSPAGSASGRLAAVGPWPAMLRHPAAVLGALGVVSGGLSAIVPGPALGADTLPANLGLYMVLAGFWFGLVTGFGVFRFAVATGAAVSGVLLGTWLAWEVAVNVAVQLDEGLLKLAGLPEPVRTYITGFVAGEVGAVLTWAAAAWFSPQLREGQTAILMGTVGALFGLLLPLSIAQDEPALLFVPWQAAVAATLGWFLAQSTSVPHGS